MADIVSVCGEFRQKHSDGDIAIFGLIAGAENRTMVPGAYPLQDQVSVFEYVALVEHGTAGRWGILRGDYTRYLRRATTTLELRFVWLSG
jgi:purine-cytosine permease-like protein